MPTKMTKKDYFTELRALADTANRTDLLDFINHEIELLAKKSTSKAPTKIQKENELIKDAIVEALHTIGRPVTVTELLTSSPSVNTMVKGINQKASALLTQLSDPKYNDCRVVRIVDKKRSLYALKD